MTQTGCQGSCLYYLFVYGSLFVILCSVSILLIPDKIDPVAYELPPPPSFKGPLAQNEKLNALNVVLKSVAGPESILFSDDFLYTGTSDGKILKISRNKEVSVLTRFGNGETTSSRGRPLGLRLDAKKEFLFVADSYLGIFKVNIKTGEHEKIFPFNNKYNQTFLDDLDILRNGDLIVSEASNRYLYDDLAMDFLESRGTGSLIKIDVEKREFETIKDGLFFPNGVQTDLTDENAVLVAETQRNRILRIFIKGPRKGKSELFINSLPGSPDNIRKTESGDGYWIAFGAVRAQEWDSGFHLLSNWPRARALIIKIFSLSSLQSLLLSRKYCLIVKVDLHGKFVESLHDPTGKIVAPITEVTEHSGSLFFGNFNSHGIGYLEHDCVKSGNRNKECFFK